MPRPLIAIIPDDAGIGAAFQIPMRAAGYGVAIFAYTEASISFGVAVSSAFIIADANMPGIEILRQ